ncbi:MAG: hypothetical protein EPO24_04025 [Bacteroidetes bacterium]|nr:MAG: hypothetical protein EPO24_04025 [Bacteroidota bacterium]
MQRSDIPQNIVYLLIYTFLVWSAFYAIIKALSSLNKEQAQTHTNLSSIQAWWFRLLAPTGLVYGLIVLTLVYLSLKYNVYEDQSKTISMLTKNIDFLEKENQNLKTVSIDTLHEQSFNVIFKMPASQPIFGGKVLLTYTYSYFKFDGLVGISKLYDGPYNKIEIENDYPMKVFLKLHDASIWGVNIFKDERSYLVFNFYRITPTQ